MSASGIYLARHGQTAYNAEGRFQGHLPVPLDETGRKRVGILGGKEAALARLRECFEASRNELPIVGVRQHYWPSNEPDIENAASAADAISGRDSSRTTNRPTTTRRLPSGSSSSRTSPQERA